MVTSQQKGTPPVPSIIRGIGQKTAWRDDEQRLSFLTNNARGIEAKVISGVEKKKNQTFPVLLQLHC